MLLPPRPHGSQQSAVQGRGRRLVTVTLAGPRAESFCCHWSRKFSTLRCGTVSLFSAGPLSLRLRTAATPPDTAVVTAKVSV